MHCWLGGTVAKLLVEGGQLLAGLDPTGYGGVIAGFMELAAALHLLIFTEAPGVPKIIDFSLDYLRAGQFRDTWAKCQVCRQGRRVANVAITAWQSTEGEPIATARAHFKIDEPLKS